MGGGGGGEAAVTGVPKKSRSLINIKQFVRDASPKMNVELSSNFLDYEKFLRKLNRSNFLIMANKYSKEFHPGFLQFLSAPKLEETPRLKQKLQKMSQILLNVSEDVRRADFKSAIRKEMGENLAYVSFNFEWPIAKEIISHLLSLESVAMINKYHNEIPLSEHSKRLSEVAGEIAADYNKAGTK